MSSKFYVGVTDSRWFHYLAARAPDEVNFWIPSPKVGFRALPEGGLFLFKLHYPQNFVVGGGFFVRYTRLPLMLVWDAFGAKNGVASSHDFPKALRRFRAADPRQRRPPDARLRTSSSGNSPPGQPTGGGRPGRRCMPRGTFDRILKADRVIDSNAPLKRRKQSPRCPIIDLECTKST